MPELKDVIGVTPLLFFFLILAFLAIKLTPLVLTHKREIKNREFDVRQVEATARREQAGALTQLAGGLGVMSETLKGIAIEQRRATDAVKLLQRVNSDSADSLSQTVVSLAERIDHLENRDAGHDRSAEPAH